MTMSMKKGRIGAASYYTDCMDAQPTKNVDDYYANSGKEPPGVWYSGARGGGPTGDRSTRLGFEDGKSFQDGDADRFHNLINGYDAEGSVALVQNAGDAKRIAFHDLTFSAPKSVSVVWSQAEQSLRDRIEQAQHAACRRALDELSTASATRAGKGGHTVLPAALRAAMFGHGSSRENDPQLHTHCVVFNLAEDHTGEVRALEIRPALTHAGAATMLYRAELAWQLRQQGFRLDAAKGNFEISGVPGDVLVHFSKRREQIKERVAQELAKLGLDPAQASKGLFDKAAIETRSAKGELTRDQLMKMWHEQGLKLGFAEDDVRKLMEEGRAAGITELDEEELLEEADEAINELTETEAVFNAAHLKTAIAARLLGRASVETIEKTYEAAKRGLLHTNNEELFTTREQLAAERHLKSLSTVKNPAHVQDTKTLASTLTEEQRDAAVGVLTDTKMCSVIEGTAGAGKTFTVSQIAKVYAAQGYNVTALATSWAAAKNLQAAADLNDAVAVAAFRSQMQQGKRTLGPRDVLILDEAGQSGVQDLRSVLAEAEKAGAKVVLLGDTKQQKAVAAGDGLRLVTKETGSWRLDAIRRQRDAGDRAAVKQFFDGHSDEALSHYDKKDQIHIEADRKEQLKKLVTDWQKSREEARAQGKPHEVLMMAVDNATVRELNEAAHQSRKDAGELGNGVLVRNMDCTGAEQRVEFGVGDHVVFRVNRHDEHVTNRTRGTIERVDASGVIHVRINQQENDGQVGHLVAIDPNDERWHDTKSKCLGMQHDYAWTVNAAQGLTVDHAFVVDSPYYNRASGGVAMSRHRDRVDLYVSHADRHEAAMRQRDADDWVPASEFSRKDVLDHMASNWTREAKKENALDFSDWKEFTGIAPDLAAEDSIERVRWQTQQAKERAKEIAEAAIERAKQGRHPGVLATQLPPAAPELKIHQHEHFKLQLPQVSPLDEEKAHQRLNVEHGIDGKTLNAATQAGMLRAAPGGKAVFVAQASNGAPMRAVDEDGKEHTGLVKVLRDRFTPMLDGNPDRVVIASDGVAALQYRSWQQRDERFAMKSGPDTVVVASASSDLANERIQQRLAQARQVRELSREEEVAIAQACHELPEEEVEEEAQQQAAAQTAQEAAERAVQQQAELQARQKLEEGTRRDRGLSL